MNVEIFGISGLPLFQPGDDIVDALLCQLEKRDKPLQDLDVVVIAQKIVSKVEGRQIELHSVVPSQEAIQLGRDTDKDPRLVQLILDESSEVVRKKPGVLIVRHRLGYVGAHAGIDQSNIDQEIPSALLLPKDPDKSARTLCRELQRRTKTRLGLIIADSANRPWRLGTVGVALGTANLPVFEDRRGAPDLFRRELKVTLTNRVDAIASAANLVMGESTEGVPIAVVRGLQFLPNKDTATLINRPLEEDLFR